MYQQKNPMEEITRCCPLVFQIILPSVSPYLIISCLSWLSGFMHLVPRGHHAGSRGVPVVGASPQQIPWLCKQLGGTRHGQHSCFKLRSRSDDLGTWEWMGMDSSPVSFGLLGNPNDGYDGFITIRKPSKTPNILVSCFDHGTCGWLCDGHPFPS